MKLILTAKDSPTRDLVGGKAAALARLASSGLPVPPWFAVSTAAGNHDSVELREAIDAAFVEQIGAGPVAVRSSAGDEDGSDHSFAGQLESYLFVSREKIIDRVIDVWKSGSSERVDAYRREHHLSVNTAPGVLVQQMIDAEVSGVAFAADPVGGSRSTIVISAVFGLGTALVGGEAEADTFRLHHDGRLIEQRIERKSIKHVRDRSADIGIRESTDIVAKAVAADRANGLNGERAREPSAGY